MRIGVVGHFPQRSYSSGLANILHTTLGQTVFIYPIHIYPEEFKYRWGVTNPKKDFPLSKIVNGADLQCVIVVQGCLNIDNDTNIPVVYYHREVERGLSCTNPTYLGLKYPFMYPLYEHPNKFFMFPCMNPNTFNSNREKDLIISYITRETCMLNYIDLIERSQYILIKDTDHKYTKTLSISVRTMEAFACKTIPLIQVTDGLREQYENIGINDSICTFWTDYFPFTKQLKYNEEKANEGYDFVMKHHTIKNRAEKILEVIKNE